MAENKSRVEQVRIRRTPKYLPFLLTGGILGVITALIVGASIPADQRTAEPIVTYLVAYFGAIGAVLGIVSALVADRISASRSKTLEATKLEG
jgi:membrane associated rhomboid family serine protease